MSTSIGRTLIGSLSFAAIEASSGVRSGFRMVAYTSYPTRPKGTAVARPMPVLVPVMTLAPRWRPACASAGLSGRLLHDFCRTAVRNLEGAL